jgi:hypothetical protein
MVNGNPIVSEKFEFIGRHTLTASTWREPGDNIAVPITVDLDEAGPIGVVGRRRRTYPHCRVTHCAASIRLRRQFFECLVRIRAALLLGTSAAIGANEPLSVVEPNDEANKTACPVSLGRRIRDATSPDVIAGHKNASPCQTGDEVPESPQVFVSPDRKVRAVVLISCRLPLCPARNGKPRRNPLQFAATLRSCQGQRNLGGKGFIVVGRGSWVQCL